MPVWSVYLECDGSPLYAHVELEDWADDDPKSEEDAWEEIRDMIMQTLEVTREED